MPTLEEVSPDVAELTTNADKLGLEDAGRRLGSDDGSNDEFHDACDQVSDTGEREKEEEFTEAELLVSKSALCTNAHIHINTSNSAGADLEG